MQPSSPHLSPERLAAFDDPSASDAPHGDAPHGDAPHGDGPPGEGSFSTDELAHLASCALCRAEQEAMAALVSMAGALGRTAPLPDAPRLVEFDTIVAGLRSAGAQVDAAHAPLAPGASSPSPLRVERGSRRSFAPLLRRAAAALLLVGSGAVFGRVTSGGGAAIGSSVAGVGGESVGGALTVRPVSLEDRPFADRSYTSVDEATAALNQAQREYERASLWLASNDTTMRDPEVFRARLAALDQMMEASRVALRDAPQDPVLNHYYLAAYSAREATLQALSSALPVDKIIERY